MSFEIRKITVQSTDNIHTLSGKIFIPEGEVKGVVHIVHGMTEYIDRYDHVMTALVNEGLAVFGYDHLGHGQTARDDSELGFIAHNYGWKYLVKDVGEFANAVLPLFPNKPVILFGHSMGSFIARLAACKFKDIYTKAIFCGTAGKNPLAAAGLALTSLLKTLRGDKHISNLVLNMAFGAYNKGFEGLSKYDWLTKDREVIARYEKDKFCTFPFTVSAMHDLITLIDKCNKSSWFMEIDKNLPILLIAGDRDPVGNYGKGVTEVYEKLKNAGCNVQLKLYEDCRHEIHNDTCKDEVITDILEFIK